MHFRLGQEDRQIRSSSERTGAAAPWFPPCGCGPFFGVLVKIMNWAAACKMRPPDKWKLLVRPLFYHCNPFACNGKDCAANKYNHSNKPKMTCASAVDINTVRLEDHTCQKSNAIGKGCKNGDPLRFGKERDPNDGHATCKQQAEPLLHTMNIKEDISAQYKSGAQNTEGNEMHNQIFLVFHMKPLV